MALTAFEKAARWHFANPPATWTVHKVDTRTWHVRTPDGTVIDRFTTRRDAEQGRVDGTYVALWHEKTAWYMGKSANPRDRSLSVEERVIIDQIVGHVTDTADTFDENGAGQVRLVRFRDREPDDTETWQATVLPEGRWLVNGVPWWTFAEDELEFLDPTPPTTPGEDQVLLDELADACDRWDRVIRDELSGNDGEHDAALTVIAIARRVINNRNGANV